MNMIKKLFRKFFKKYAAISFKQGFDLTSLPIITLYQGNNKFNFILDTGSNNSVIDASILPYVEHTVLDSTSMWMGAEGNQKESKVCEISFLYIDKEYKYKYIVQDLKAAFDAIKQETGVTLHGVIGSKFFNEYKYVLDFDELIAYSKA